MKKLILLALALCLLVSCASADVVEDIYWDYAPCAKTFGAPMFEKDGLHLTDAEKNVYRADVGMVNLVFEITMKNKIKTALVCAKDDSCAADFLCSCAAMVAYLGGINSSAYGNILSSFAMIRGGSDSVPGTVGIDAYQVISNDDFKYVFVYQNNDLTVSY